MLDGREDQAAGLRRLFRRAPPNVAALFVTGHDRAVIAALAARRMSREGRVALLDEGRGEAGVASGLGVSEEGDLLNLIDGRTALDSLLRVSPEGVLHLPIGGAALAFALLDDDYRERLLTGLHALQRRCSLMLIHASLTGTLPHSPFVQAAPRRLLLVEASGRGVTDAYASIKALAAAGAGDLHVAVARARSRAEAVALFAQLDGLVRMHVGLPLAFLGEVERDDLGAALAAQPAVRSDHAAAAAFLRRLAGWSRPSSGCV